MKPNQSQKDQIRKMEEEKYPISVFASKVRNVTQLANQGCFQDGAEALLERLDIDLVSIALISQLWNMRQLSDDEAKQQILNAIRISG
jgi:hypothetical protein